MLIMWFFQLNALVFFLAVYLVATPIAYFFYGLTRFFDAIKLTWIGAFFFFFCQFFEWFSNVAKAAMSAASNFSS